MQRLHEPLCYYEHFANLAYQLSVLLFRYIRSINRKNLPYKLSINHFADLTDDEFSTYKGLINDDDADDDSGDADEEDDDASSLNDEFDSPESYNGQYLGDSNVDEDQEEVSTRDQIVKHYDKLENEFKRKYTDGIPTNLDWRMYGKAKSKEINDIEN